MNVTKIVAQIADVRERLAILAALEVAKEAHIDAIERMKVAYGTHGAEAFDALMRAYTSESAV